MNKKKENKKETEKRKLDSVPRNINVRAIVLGTIGVILTIAVCVVIAFEQLYQPVLLTINGDKYRLNDVRYYIFSREYQGFTTEYSYQSYMNMSYWDQVVDEETGDTNLDQVKAQTWDDIVKNEILYKEAVKQGYSVTDEDKTNVQTVISNTKENLDSAILRSNGFTDSALTAILQKLEVASRFQQDTIDSFDIDDDAIKDGFNYEDYHQYGIGVFKIQKTKTNEDNKTEDVPEEELKAALEKLEGLKDKIASAEDLSTVLGEDETAITYSSENITKDTTTYGKKNLKKIMQMKNGEMTDMIEREDAYYLIKMVNNKVTESYDSAVSNAISAEETSQFDDYYEKLEKEYTVEKNDNEWDALDFGYITINAYTGQAI